MLRPFPSFLDVSRSFAGRMRDDRQRFEANAVLVVPRERDMPPLDVCLRARKLSST
jgi:hypothetical protein